MLPADAPSPALAALTFTLLVIVPQIILDVVYGAAGFSLGLLVAWLALYGGSHDR